MKNKKATLTAARNEAQIQVFRMNADENYSNTRIRPYYEIYRGSNEVMDTPVQNIIRAAEDEEKRKGN
jgi:hypothetical protein